MVAVEEPLESRVAVLESKVQGLKADFDAVRLDLRGYTEAVQKERTEMAEERGALKQAKWVIPVLTTGIGFLSGILVTLVTSHVL